MDDQKLVDADRLLAAVDSAVQHVGRPRELDETLSLAVHSAVHSVPGAEHAGIELLSDNNGLESRACSSETVTRLHRLQTDLREGPCRTAVWKESTVVVSDLAAEADQWPEFVPRAQSLGVASVLSFRLYLESDTLGVLSLYSSVPGGFTSESRAIAGLFASHAALVVGSALQVGNLKHAVSTRDLIGQAKGILMERFGVTAEDAFDLLVRSSQQTHVKLVDVARWLVGTVGGKQQK